VVHKDQLRAKNLSEAVLSHSSLKDLENAHLSKGIPSVKEIPKPVTGENLDLKNRMLLHNKDKINIDHSREIRDPSKQRIVNREFGYPSSLRQKIDKYINPKTNKDAKSIVEKAFNYFSSGKNQYIKSRTDPITSKRSSSLSSTNKSASRSQPKRSVSQTKKSSGSKTRKSSSSKTVKKKKK